MTVIGKHVGALVSKGGLPTAQDAKTLSEYGRLVLLVCRESRQTDEADAEDMDDTQVAEFLIKTIGVAKLKQSLSDMGAL